MVSRIIMMMAASHITHSIKEFLKSLRSHWKQVFEQRNHILDLAPKVWNERFKKKEFGFKLFKKLVLDSKLLKLARAAFLDRIRALPPGCFGGLTPRSSSRVLLQYLGSPADNCIFEYIFFVFAFILILSNWPAYLQHDPSNLKRTLAPPVFGSGCIWSICSAATSSLTITKKHLLITVFTNLSQHGPYQTNRPQVHRRKGSS
jgi:hypothetical protein